MPYTVFMPGGTKDFEFEGYVRLLEKQGVDIANTPRTPEPGTDNRWVCAWENEEEAKKFAEELKKTTKNNAWRVQRLNESSVSQGPLGPLEIYVGLESDGSTYALHPISRKLIKKLYPDARIRRSVFVGSEEEPNEKVDDKSYDRVVALLTGLADPQIKRLGGYRIHDPENEEDIFDRVVQPKS